jgi:SanA protein
MKLPQFTKKQRRGLVATLIALPILGAFLVGFTNETVMAAGRDRIYEDETKISERRVALVLGTAPEVQGRQNLFFEGRMRAAAKLFRAGKVEKILVSGDNGRRGYDEPTAMKERLIALGVPADRVTCDFAGFRTLDSLVRAKEVFGVTELTLVTDEFHLPRSLYIAKETGIDAIGFASEFIPMNYSRYTHTREIGARTLIWLDLHVLGTQPKFLGKKEPI